MNAMDIVVGIDGSINAALALDWAADEATRRTSRLVVVHASAVLDSAAYSSATLDMMRADATLHGERVLTEAVTAMATLHPGLPVTTILRHDRPADVLIELSGPNSIVAVGSRGGNRVSGALLGSISQRVAAHAAGTVAVIGAGGRGHSSAKAILVGVSNSPGGRAALDFACAEAALRGCRVTAVRAYGVFGRSRHLQIYGALPGLREYEAAVLSEATRRLQAEHPEAPIDCELVDEEPTVALARLARDAELLVLGCRHPDDHWPSRLGPITGALLHHVPCPVAIVGLPRTVADRDTIRTGQPAAVPDTVISGGSP
jgi:nucleotide-binding universal stress UspA family protein